MEVQLPETLRPRNVWYRKCSIGIDLPSDFIDNLQAIDQNLFPVYHCFNLLWDSIINDYSGELEDPRNQINYNYGHLNFGFVLTDGQGKPVEKSQWHIWRLCDPYGWAHVVGLESTESEYLNMFLKRLKLQADWTNKYGHHSYNKLLAAGTEKQQEQLMKDKQSMFDAVQDENKWLTRKAMENFDRGVTAPTNATKETIQSFAGQKHRSKLVRPLEDEDVGLVTLKDN